MPDADPLLIACPACGGLNRVPAARLGAGPVCGKCKAALFAGKPIDVGVAAFDRHVTRATLPVLVDFWAEWCEPCKRMEPLLKELAGELSGKLKVAKVNVEAHPAIANQFRVRGLPTFMLFKNGQVHSTQIGAISKSQLAQFVAKAI